MLTTAAWTDKEPASHIARMETSAANECFFGINRLLSLASSPARNVSPRLADSVHRPGWKAKLGAAKAITAMAHKLARILWHLIKYKQAYDPTVWAAAEEKLRQKKIKRLQQNAAALGFKLLCTA
jgi:hypothetical protein